MMKKRFFYIFLTLLLIGSVGVTFSQTQGLVELQKSTRAVAEDVLPTVVKIDTRSTIKIPVRQFGFSFDPFNPFGGNRDNNEEDEEENSREFSQTGLGSGIIVKKDKHTFYVLTNAHVIKNADEILVTTMDEEDFEAELIGLDSGRDLALISFKSKKKDFPIAKLGDSDSIQPGDIVFAVGNPYGFRSSITFGIISALNRTSPDRSSLTNYIQTDAAVNRGNSGGPLVNIKGEVIGINTWIWSSGGGGNEGLSFAVPINNAKFAIDDFIEKGSIDYGWLGASIGKIYEEEMASLKTTEGVLIIGIYSDSPAHKVGVEVGDVVLEVNGEKVKDDADLVRKITGLAPGDVAKLKLLRGNRILELTVTLGRRNVEGEIPPENVWPGFSVVDITSNLKKRLDLSTSSGVVVSKVDKGSPADVAGLKVRDVIERVNNRKVKNMQEFFEELRKVEDDEEANFRLNRNGVSLVVGIVK